MTETSAPNPPEQAHLRGTTPAPPLEPSARADSRRQDVDSTTVALVTLGCARNEVDSEELAGRLAEDGFTLVDDAADADTVLVNTCGFVEAAKKDSVDELLAASDLKESGRTQKVVAVGCMAERYGKELAEALPEADAVLGFDDYPDIAARVRGLLDGGTHDAHTPVDRRTLLPITPVARAAAAESDGTVVPGHDWVPSVRRRRLTAGPYAPLKLASGCDRRCTFCAIPRFRGAYLSRPPEDLLAEASWLAEQGVKELFLVSENTTSYGKDLGDLRLLEKRVLPALAGVDGIERVRVSYLQPAEVRPGLIEAIATTDGVVPYFDLSFQHASASVLRRMRRFGDTERFLSLIEQVRAANPAAGIRSNVIVGFPGETADDFTELCDFLEAARLDVVGVFGYSDEENTEAASYDDKIDADVISSRLDELSQLVEELTTQRAEDRVGESITVLVEQVDDDAIEGRADHQGPEVDGSTELVVGTGGPDVRIGDLVSATVVDSDGADLIAEPVEAE